jgi:hypothetical protein
MGYERRITSYENKTHMGTQFKHQNNIKTRRESAFFTYIWAPAEPIFVVGGPLNIYPVGAPTPLDIGNTLEKKRND